MRPLVVLLLVVGALGALLFTLFSGSETRRTDPAPRVEPGQEAPAEGVADLREPGAPETEVVRRVPEEARQAVLEDQPTGAARVEPGALEGRILDTDREPIAEATIELLDVRVGELDEMLYAMRNVEPPRPVARATTDAQGAFRFDRLDPRKEWTLVVRHESYRPVDAGPIRIPEGDTWREEIVLEPGKTCSGVVTDATTGAPIAGARLVVDNAIAISRRRSPTRLEVTTDASGAYVFENVRTGHNTLMITAQGYATQIHNNFSLVNFGEPPTRFVNRQPPATLESKQQNFQLGPGKTIAGRVIGPDRAPMAGVQLEALNQAGAIGCRGDAVSGKNGEFLLEGLSEGFYTVRVQAKNHDAAPAQRVEAGETNLIITLFEQASVTGKVLDASGRPLSAFTVKLRMANEVNNVFGAMMDQKAVKGSSDGSFEFGGVAEGSYVVEGLADGYASSFSEPFNAVQGLTSADVVVHMSRGGSLRGKVIDAYSGEPVAGAEVKTQDNNWVDGDFFELFNTLEPSALSRRTVYTDASGNYELDLLTPGDYQLRIAARGYSTIALNDVSVVDGQRVEVPLQTVSKGAVILGRVFGRDGEPVPGATVQLTPTDVNAIQGSRTTRTDASGGYRIENALAGGFRLSAMRPSTGSSSPFEAIGDLKLSEIEVTIADGREYEYDLYMSGRR
jgi:uncharacterized GH25 family protein